MPPAIFVRSRRRKRSRRLATAPRPRSRRIATSRRRFIKSQDRRRSQNPFGRIIPLHVIAVKTAIQVFNTPGLRLRGSDERDGGCYEKVCRRRSHSSLLFAF